MSHQTMSDQLTGKRIFVTGSSTGVGFSFAKMMRARGASVCFHSHESLSRCPALLELGITDQGFVHANLSDISQPERIAGVVDTAWEKIGGIDVLCLNAGTYGEPHFLQLTPATLLKTFNLNTFAPTLLLQRWANRRKKEGLPGGKAIATSSINARIGETQHTAYDASKRALEGVIGSAALDLCFDPTAPPGWVPPTVIGVALGLVDTPLTHDAISSAPIAAALKRVIPLGVSNPDELAPTFCFLASDESRAMTGTIVPLDGGIALGQVTVAAERLLV